MRRSRSTLATTRCSLRG